jgi:hypothetical protein
MIGTVTFTLGGWVDPASGEVQEACCIVTFENGFWYTLRAHALGKFKSV